MAETERTGPEAGRRTSSKTERTGAQAEAEAVAAGVAGAQVDAGSESASSRSTSATGSSAASNSGEEFGRLTDPYRGELLAHCYRMLGSVHDAEDLVQETYLRAWRSYGGFEGRASLRTWLYRIATNACLTALEQRERRALPSGLAAAYEPPQVQRETQLATDIAWLEPMPDALVGLGSGPAAAADPATVVVSRASMRLAWVAALQLLPPRQRAALILHDVLAWRAHEVADLLGTTTAAVNSALQRARAQLQQDAPAEDSLIEPEDPKLRSVLDRYAAAFERIDLPELLRLLRDDVVLEMPPGAMWYSGRDDVSQFFRVQVFSRRTAYVLLPTSANGQPAFVSYRPHEDGVLRPHSLQVLTITDSGISRITAFLEPDEAQVAAFGVPPALPIPSATDASPR